MDMMIINSVPGMACGFSWHSWLPTQAAVAISFGDLP